MLLYYNDMLGACILYNVTVYYERKFIMRTESKYEDKLFTLGVQCCDNI